MTNEDEEWTIVYAVKGNGFQEYKYANDERVPDGTPIGIEKGNELKMLEGIYFSDEADNYEDRCPGCGSYNIQKVGSFRECRECGLNNYGEDA